MVKMIARHSESLRKMCLCVMLDKDTSYKALALMMTFGTDDDISGGVMQGHMTVVCHHCSCTFDILSLFCLIYNKFPVPYFIILLLRALFPSAHGHKVDMIKI